MHPELFLHGPVWLGGCYTLQQTSPSSTVFYCSYPYRSYQHCSNTYCFYPYYSYPYYPFPYCSYPYYPYPHLQ